MQRNAPVPSGKQREWWTDLATETDGNIEWSARYHEVTKSDTTKLVRIQRGTETWVVIGPGLERTQGTFAAVPGRWQVYAGYRIAYPLDGPARLALTELKKPLDTYFDRDCSGYLKR